MLIRWRPPGDDSVRDDLVERIAELDRLIEQDQKDRGELKQELRLHDYQQMFNRVTEGDEIPWDQLCWPGSSNGEEPDYIKCIVCGKGFKRFQGTHHSGAFIGGGIGQPNVHVHDRCMPVKEREYIRNAY